jgi:hypothetical protein
MKEQSEMKKLMSARILATCLVALAIASLIGMRILARNAAAQKSVATEDRLVVHEWGTFTSIAGKDGVALEWRPLNGPTDLPKFVHTIQKDGEGLRHVRSKAELTAQVRMETPVVYFYSSHETEVSVKVDFPKGKITEWYPQARSVDTSINWGRLKVMPGAALNLPVDYSPSHYYPARETDAAPIQLCATAGKPAEQEKFLFYRGVGTFDLPLSVKLDGDKIWLKNASKDQIANLIVFENRSGKIGYRTYNNFSGEVTQERPALDQNLTALLSELKLMLVGAGLYEKEADSMIKTWSNSWFEEGMRVFYVLPRQTTDAILPMTIEPRPAELVRVLVGRAELITPEMEKSVQRQVSLLGDASPAVRQTAMQTIRKYGRFSEPILKSILQRENNAVIRKRVQELIDTGLDKSE